MGFRSQREKVLREDEQKTSSAEAFLETTCNLGSAVL